MPQHDLAQSSPEQVSAENPLPSYVPCRPQSLRTHGLAPADASRFTAPSVGAVDLPSSVS